MSTNIPKLHQPLRGLPAMQEHLRRAREEARRPYSSIPKMLFPGDRMKNAKTLMNVLREGLDIIGAISELGWDAQGIQETTVVTVPSSRAQVWSAYLTKLLSPEGITSAPVGRIRGQNSSHSSPLRSPLRGQRDGILIHFKKAENAHVAVNVLSQQLLHIARVIACKQPDKKTDEGYSYIPKGLRHILAEHGVPSSRWDNFTYFNAANTDDEYASVPALLADAEKAYDGLRLIMRQSYLPPYQSVEQLPLYE